MRSTLYHSLSGKPVQDLLAEVDAGIFLDTDTVLLDDPALLWDRSPIEDLAKLLGQTDHYIDWP